MQVTALIEPGDRAFAGAVAAVFSGDPDTELRVLGVDEAPDGRAVAVVVASRIADVMGVDLPLVVVDRELNEGRFVSALEAGATAYITQAEFLERGADICREVLKGNPIVPPRLLGTLLRQVIHMRRQARAAEDRLEHLTAREQEVFDLAAQGLGRADIAEALFVSVGTVRTHMQRIFKKLEIHSQAELVALAAQTDSIGDFDD